MIAMPIGPPARFSEDARGFGEALGVAEVLAVDFGEAVGRAEGVAFEGGFGKALGLAEDLACAVRDDRGALGEALGLAEVVAAAFVGVVHVAFWVGDDGAAAASRRI
eukprot:4319003-Alexandrium_andersonii.AAC.1